ncbi:hypothetical protein IEQ34_017879 [Dendrobium chrysotoxum]|uniref:Uncharacterized protein n=1 Tax=Dendrobium chrysotoxum TaxID=161865 RepID=A0AAV7FV15_DENCH|nr:hypothetical protein IEQ34_017879 [Dendrobium chrysotoxum]
MEVPAWDYGLVLDEDDNIDILRSPFFDVGFDFDDTVEEYFDRIHITLVDTIDDQRAKGRWTILGRLTTASLPDTPPLRGYFTHFLRRLTYTIGKQVAAIRQRLLSGCGFFLQGVLETCSATVTGSSTWIRRAPSGPVSFGIRAGRLFWFLFPVSWTKFQVVADLPSSSQTPFDPIPATAADCFSTCTPSLLQPTLQKYMPCLAGIFPHVLVDVSSITALCMRWFPKEKKAAPTKEKRHRAMDDIKESIRELKYYKESIFKGFRKSK